MYLANGMFRLTYLEVWVHSQGFVYQTMAARVPGLQVHDVALCFLIGQRDRGELQGETRMIKQYHNTSKY